MVYPEPCKEITRRPPLLTFIYPGFDCGSPPASRARAVHVLGYSRPLQERHQGLLAPAGVECERVGHLPVAQLVGLSSSNVFTTLRGTVAKHCFVLFFCSPRLKMHGSPPKKKPTRVLLSFFGQPPTKIEQNQKTNSKALRR